MPEHQQIQQSKKSDTTFQKQATPTKQIPLSNPMAIIQRAKIDPKSLTHADVMQLQRTIGNRAVGRLLSEIGMIPSTAKPVQRQETPEEEETCPSCLQRQEIPEEEEPLQGKMIETIQRQEIPEEEEPLQGKMADTVQRQEIPEEEEPLQGKMIGTVQRQEIPEEEETLQGKMIETIQRKEIPKKEEPLQGKMIETIQRKEIPEEEEPLQTKRENNTGMPDNLKAGVENLSGIDMSDVRVHFNSYKPAEVGALAYTQGTDIHVAHGQERHLPHEAWHVVQQKQGRVQPTMQLKNMALNDDKGLEQEANVMGERALKSEHGSIVTKKDSANCFKVSQMFFHPDTLNNYQDAAIAWDTAYKNVIRFNSEIDSGMKEHADWRIGNSALTTLSQNAGTKSNRAAGTMAGEAYETYSWKTGAHEITGPGGGVGIDIRTYQPGIPAVSNRKQIEVKSGRTTDAIKDGLDNAITVQHATNIKVHYTGNNLQADIVNYQFDFVRAAVHYQECAFEAQQGRVGVEVYDNRGTPIRRFGLFW